MTNNDDQSPRISVSRRNLHQGFVRTGRHRFCRCWGCCCCWPPPITPPNTGADQSPSHPIGRFVPIPSGSISANPPKSRPPELLARPSTLITIGARIGKHFYYLTIKALGLTDLLCGNSSWLPKRDRGQRRHSGRWGAAASLPCISCHLPYPIIVQHTAVMVAVECCAKGRKARLFHWKHYWPSRLPA